MMVANKKIMSEIFLLAAELLTSRSIFGSSSADAINMAALQLAKDCPSEYLLAFQCTMIMNLQFKYWTEGHYAWSENGNYEGEFCKYEKLGQLGRSIMLVWLSELILEEDRLAILL